MDVRDFPPVQPRHAGMYRLRVECEFVLALEITLAI